MSVGEKGSEPPPVLLFELFPVPGRFLGADFLIPIHLAEVDQQFPVTISFPPLDNSAGSTLQDANPGTLARIRVYGSQNDNYAHGALHIKRAAPARGSEFCFGLCLSVSQRFLEDLFTWLSQIWLVIPLMLTLWLPGSLLLQALLGSMPFSSQDAWSKFALSVGMSLAIIPILFLWTTTFKIQLTQVGIFLIAACWSGFENLAEQRVL